MSRFTTLNLYQKGEKYEYNSKANIKSPPIFCARNARQINLIISAAAVKSDYDNICSRTSHIMY